MNRIDLVTFQIKLIFTSGKFCIINCVDHCYFQAELRIMERIFDLVFSGLIVCKLMFLTATGELAQLVIIHVTHVR